MNHCIKTIYVDILKDKDKYETINTFSNKYDGSIIKHHIPNKYGHLSYEILRPIPLGVFIF